MIGPKRTLKDDETTCGHFWSCCHDSDVLAGDCSRAHSKSECLSMNPNLDALQSYVAGTP